MHARALILAVVLGTFGLSAYADETVRIFAQILVQADTVEQRYAAAVALVEHGDETAAPYVADVLNRVLAGRSSVRRGPELELYERMTRLLVKTLGDWRYTNAAPALMRAVEDSSDPLTRAEAMMALGSMRAVEYAARIALILRNLDMTPPPDTDSGEKVAYGAIIALERMRSPAGFAPVFYATDAWYGKRVREQAERSLPLILADPTDAIAELIAVETPARAIGALNLELRSQATADRKIRIAGIALGRGIAMSPGKNRADQLALAGLRTGAMDALVALEDRSGGFAALFAESYRIAATDERLVALKALGADRSQASAVALRDIILRLDADQKAGVVDEIRNALAKAALQNAAINGNKVLLPALYAVQTNPGWSNSIISLAKDAIKALE